jgi:hypothetical protein
MSSPSASVEARLQRLEELLALPSLSSNGHSKNPGGLDDRLAELEDKVARQSYRIIHLVRALEKKTSELEELRKSKL